MNILILSTHFNPGGISRYCLNLAKGLKMRGHKVWIASDKGEWIRKLEEKGVNHKIIPLKTKFILSPKIILSFFILSSFILKEKIHIIHSNTRITQYLSYLLYKVWGIPYVSSFHGSYRPNFFRKLFKFSGLKAIAVSKTVKKHLVEDLKIEESKIRVIYNGIDREEFLTKIKRKTDFGFREEDFLIGILGRISEEKGHFLAAQAIKFLSLKYTNIYLLVGGRGRLEQEFKALLKLIKIEERVRFISRPAEEFLDILDLLIIPSQKEGFGYVVLEAFAKGVPVVGYNTGGIAEIIENRKNGLLFYNYDSVSLGKTIEEIILEPDLVRKITKEANKDVLFFSLEKMVQNTEEVYKGVRS